MRFLFLTLAFSTLAFGRSPVIPLMPPRAFASAPMIVREKSPVYRESKSEHSILAVELGTLGRSESTKSDAIGLQLLWGGRIVSRLPVVLERLFLKASLGYFRKAESVGSVAVKQNVFEAGLGLQYALVTSETFKWLFGISNRLDLALSTISVYNNSNTSDPFWRYRVGPATGISARLASNLTWVTDVELSFAVSQGSRRYGALTTGLAFDLN